MATIRVTLSMLTGQPLGSFEVSMDQELGQLTANDIEEIITGILAGLDMARTRDQEDCFEDYAPEETE